MKNFFGFALFFVLFCIVGIIVGVVEGDPAQTWDDIKPIQCHKGCTLLNGDWPQMYGCSEYDFQESE